MKRFRLLNNVTGWAAFLVAAATYLLTIESTASLWDCGEFIATAFKMEVGHPPGAPLFMICGKVFGLLSFGDNTKFALMVNAFSALMSAFTILFLFWSITHLARKLVIKSDEDFTLGNYILILGSGLVGALAYTFSDTFWFSAVEGEVYAFSSFFTAIVFWIILKWEDSADEAYANRWIILIAYLMGLSIGVHLLNLLAIPAIVLVYYFKKYPATPRGIILSLIISVMVLGFVMYGIIPGLIKVASWFELLFVNTFGLPFNTGILFYSILIIGGLIWGMYYSYKHQKALLNTILLAVTMIIIGYSSFAMIVIRSLADPPINENNPSNVFALLSYLNREQYGDRPLLYGQYYNAPATEMKEGKAIYVPMNGKYEVVAHNQDYEYDKQFLTIFPRMFSPDGSHIRVYKEWANIKGRPVTIKNPRTGEDMKEYVPTFGENLTFFFKYQVGWMYFRYFMWNFVGRQNDSQGHGEIQDGNWISGFDALDGVMIGDQKHLPDHMKNVPSRNKYYFLPLLLGLLGLFFHMKWNMKDFSVVLMLFIMTGLAIVVYLNQTPIQPRERDYAYAGSFYAFTIWIGLGVLNIALFMKKFLKNPAARASLATGICLLAVPALMAKENWDDHDRSGRYAAKAYAADYLNSCAKNAILFTYGDNDTFPLWYAQEVEGIRTDVRVVNTMLLNTDWYINQMKQKYYESDPLPITLADEKYLSERRSVTYVIERMKDTISIQQGFDFAASDEDKYKIIPQYGNQRIDHVPSRNYYMDVDPEAVLASGTVKADEASLIPKKMIWKITKNYLGKGDLIMMDIIAHNNWKRPIYFAAPTADATIGLQEYLQNEGIVYRLVPIRTRCSGYDCGRMKTDLIYENLMNKFEWGRLNEPDVYIDHFHQRTLMILRLRSNYAKLAQALLMEGKKDTAIKVLDRCIEMIPSKKVPHDLGSLDMISTYFMAGATDKGTRMLKELDNQSASELKYYFSLKPRLLKMSEYEIRKNLQMQNELMTMAKQFGQNDLSPKIEKQFNEYYDKFLKLTGNSR